MRVVSTYLCTDRSHVLLRADWLLCCCVFQDECCVWRDLLPETLGQLPDRGQGLQQVHLPYLQYCSTVGALYNSVVLVLLYVVPQPARTWLDLVLSVLPKIADSTGTGYFISTYSAGGPSEVSQADSVTSSDCE